MRVCVFAFGALRSYRVFVGQNADNVFFPCDVLAEGRNETLQVTTVHEVFTSFSEAAVITVKAEVYSCGNMLN